MTFPFVLRPQRPGLTGEAAVAALGPVGLFNPCDLSSMFITSDGQTEVASNNDPVGLWLDKSQMGGKTAAQFVDGQPELATNGGFDDASWWNTDPGWSIFAGTAIATAANDQLYSPVMIEAGKTYRISVELKSYTSGSFRAVIAGSVHELPTTIGTHSFIAKADLNDRIRFGNAGSNFTGVIDNVSAKEIPGNHVSQPDSAKRPAFRTDGTHCWLRGDDADDILGFAANPLIGATAAYGIATVALGMQPPFGGPDPGAPFGGFGTTGFDDHAPWVENSIYEGFAVDSRQLFGWYPFGSTSPHFYETVNDGANLSVYVASAQVGPVRPITFALGPAPALLGSPVSGFPYKGNVYGIALFPRVPDAAETTLIKQFLASISPVTA